MRTDWRPAPEAGGIDGWLRAGFLTGILQREGDSVASAPPHSNGPVFFTAPPLPEGPHVPPLPLLVGIAVACTTLPALTLAESLPTEASAPTTDVLEEIIVTAQKRSERLQDVPVSVATLAG